jgi:uncharacterized surface protein with fasciclin (FAS1) repeats
MSVSGTGQFFEFLLIRSKVVLVLLLVRLRRDLCLSSPPWRLINPYNFVENVMIRSTLSILSTLILTASISSVANAGPSLGACNSVQIAQFDGSIVDAALATPELSTLVDAVLAAGLEDALATTENITVYAPTNDAFDALPEGFLNTVVGDVDILTAVLTYHVSPGRSDPRRHTSPVSRPTLQGQKVFFSRYDTEARVNQAAVDCQGVKTDNGLVWIIDSVLLPQF